MYTLLESHSEQDINTMINILKRLGKGESEEFNIDRALEVLVFGAALIEAVDRKRTKGVWSC